MNVFKRYLKRAIDPILIVSFVSFLSACGGGGDDGTGDSANAAAVTPKWAYVANEFDNTVSQFSVGTDGKLTPLSVEAVPTGDGPQSITVDPSGRFVYVASADGKIAQFSIATEAGKEGSLVDLGVITPTTSGASLRSIAVDQSGKYVYAANAGSTSDAVWQFSIGSDGRLSRLTNAHPQPGKGMRSVAADPKGNYVYALNEADDTDRASQFSIGSDGTLSSVSAADAATGSAPFSFAVHPTSPYAYATNLSGDSFISQYKLINGALSSNGTVLRAELTDGTADANGVLLKKDPGGQPRSIAVDPSGHYAYVANTGSDASGKSADAVLRFSIGADGKLNPSGSTAAGSDPQFVNIDPSGHYVYVANAGDDTISQYGIETNGNLKSLGAVKVQGKAKSGSRKNHPICIVTTPGPYKPGHGSSSSGTTSSGTTSSGTTSSGTTSSGTTSSGTTSSGTTSSGTTSSGTTSSGTTSSGTTSSGTTSSGTTSSGTTSSGTTSSGTTSSGTTSSGTTSSGTTSSGTSSSGTSAPSNGWVVGSWNMSDAANGVGGYVSVNSDLKVLKGSTVTVENCTTRTSASTDTTYSLALTCGTLFSSKTWKVSQPAKGTGIWVCEGAGTYTGKNVGFIYPSTDGKTCDVSSTLGAGNEKVNPGAYGSASLKLWYVTHWYGIFGVTGSFTWSASSPDQASFTGGWVSTDTGAPKVSGGINGTVKKNGTGTFTYEDSNGVTHTGSFAKI